MDFSQINFDPITGSGKDHEDADRSFYRILMAHGYIRLHYERINSMPLIFPSEITQIIIEYFNIVFKLDLAQKIWINAAKDMFAMPSPFRLGLAKLYPHLITDFINLTECKRKQPTLQQIETFFARHGGKYNNNDPYIWDHSFDIFCEWFFGMCWIIKDIRPMYDRDEDYLICLFYTRNTAQECLISQPEGTFILRLASRQDGLVITYKNPQSKIQHVLLTRVGDERYKVGKSDKLTFLFNLIRPWTKLKYLYTPNKLIRKTFVF